MSLFIHLTVGHHTVDHIRVSRISNTGTATLDPDDVSTYQVDRDVYGTGEPMLAIVTHRYGDGATELARLALNALTPREGG